VREGRERGEGERGGREGRERGERERGESHLRALAHALGVLDRARGELHEPVAAMVANSGGCSLDESRDGYVQ
jgi:hypothetical protein